MELVIIALLLGLIPAYIASAKGRNFLLWWFYGTVLFAFAIIHAIAIRPAERNLFHYGMRYCPHCRKAIRVDATSCNFCEKEVEPIDLLHE
jgi:hypothetical protein